MSWSHPRRIVWLLAAATVIPIGVLSALGARVVQQDRASEIQRRREALEVAGLRLALDIDRQLQTVESRLARGDGIRFSQTGLTSSTDLPILYQPAATAEPGSPTPASFREAEVLEHQRGDLVAADSAYRALVGSTDPGFRGAALLGLGRVLRKRGDRTRSLEAYADLENLGLVTVAEQPAALVARLARARIFEEAGDGTRLRQAAIDLGLVLGKGGWPIDKPTFEVYRELVERGGGALPAGAAARTEAGLRLWRSWRANELPASGRRILHDAGIAVLAIWAGGPTQPVAWFTTSTELGAEVDALAKPDGIQAAGRDLEGRPLFGRGRDGGTSLMPRDTRLPFVLDVSSVNAMPGDAGSRRAVLVGGLSVAFLLMLAAAFGLYRATTRELELARQQADFVSAVSHEFRTPLTSMRHLTDLLATRDVQSEERRQHYYQLLAHETERLSRMVESLLSFGRMEAGAYAWRLEAIDVAGLLDAVIAEFRDHRSAASRDITVEIEPGLPAILADAEALSRAVWNLMENAAKYSPGDAPIRAFARRSGRSIRVGVGDRGIGIPPEEREHIFRKFGRGEAATRRGIRGVGIGLTLVKRIVEAHGGSIEIESESGQGSTFTLVIPCHES